MEPVDAEKSSQIVRFAPKYRGDEDRILGLQQVTVQRQEPLRATVFLLSAVPVLVLTLALRCSSPTQRHRGFPLCPRKNASA